VPGSYGCGSYGIVDVEMNGEDKLDWTYHVRRSITACKWKERTDETDKLSGLGVFFIMIR